MTKSDWTYINPRSVSRYEPSLEKISCWIKQFLNVCGLAPVAAPQSRTVSSYDADASFLPSREKAIALAMFVWPSSVYRAALVAASQSRTISSYDADANVLLSHEETTALTLPVWPSNVGNTVRVAASQGRTVSSSDTDAIALPSHEKGTALA
jgi:hypothetical protein